MKEITRITPPTIDIEISNIASNKSLKLTLNEYEFWTLRLEFAQGLRTFDKVKYAVIIQDNYNLTVSTEEGTILQDGACTLPYEPFSINLDIQFEILKLKNRIER
jgi:hypothetical protein